MSPTAQRRRGRSDEMWDQVDRAREELAEPAVDLDARLDTELDRPLDVQPNAQIDTPPDVDVTIETTSEADVETDAKTDIEPDSQQDDQPEVQTPVEMTSQIASEPAKERASRGGHRRHRSMVDSVRVVEALDNLGRNEFTKGKIPMNGNLPEPLVEGLNDFCAQHKIARYLVLSKLIEQFLEGLDEA